MTDVRSTRGADQLTEAEEILAEEEAAARVAAGETEADDDAKKKKNSLPEIPIAERAVIESQADLDRVLAAHGKWIAAVFDPRQEVAAGRANLQGLDLRTYNLKGANLSGANLQNTNLQGVDLTRANLTVANLQGAQLQGANLQGAKLMRVKIEGANLSGADLTGALLNGIDLSKVTMTAPVVETIDEDTAMLATAAPERQGATSAANSYDAQTHAPELDADEGAADLGHGVAEGGATQDGEV